MFIESKFLYRRRGQTSHLANCLKQLNSMGSLDAVLTFCGGGDWVGGALSSRGLSSKLLWYKVGVFPVRVARRFSSGLSYPSNGFADRPSLVWEVDPPTPLCPPERGKMREGKQKWRISRQCIRDSGKDYR